MEVVHLMLTMTCSYRTTMIFILENKRIYLVNKCILHHDFFFKSYFIIFREAIALIHSTMTMPITLETDVLEVCSMTKVLVILKTKIILEMTLTIQTTPWIISRSR